MIVTDILQILGIALFLSAWWLTVLPGRRRALGFAAAWVIATGVAGAFDERWQAVVGALSGAAFALAVLLEARLARRAPRRVPWRSGTLLAALGLASVAALYLFPVLPLPTPSGPFAVGMRTFELVDETRRGVLYAGKDEPRRLLVRVWYPAQPAPDAREAPYFSDVEARTTAHGMGERLGFPPLLSYLKHVRTHAYADAPLAPQDGKLPSVFFSHGYTSFLSQNSVLMETLASHGYAVYAVQHTYDASPSVFPNGDVLPMDPALIDLMRNGPEARGEFPPALIEGYTSASFDKRLDGQLRNAAATLARGDRIVAQSASIWLADRLFVHDRLERGAVPAAAAEVVAASDFARTGEMGMSFGGSVTGALCLIDKRCAAGVNLDGGDFHYLPFDADMPVPFLMFHSDSDYFYRFFKVKTDGHERSYNDFSYERFDHAGQRQDLYRLQLKGAAHNGLSDLSWFMRRPLRDALLGTAPTEILLGAQNDFVLAFFDKHLRRLKNDFPQAQYARYAGWAWPYDNTPVRQWWLAKPEAERAALQKRIAELKAVAYSKIFSGL
ncbi:hypothetical protein [Pseudomonas sp. RIT-PI-AD]|uniref:alpha/beta hydrolase n=1 Tax=Pseudomonas sp. RIT-PI-AD TaxID=3035294 RepID=UPI0021DA0308|nr:hypothetical protein [Pseudomonas sp. RIT-PI-AD]